MSPGSYRNLLSALASACWALIRDPVHQTMEFTHTPKKPNIIVQISDL